MTKERSNLINTMCIVAITVVVIWNFVKINREDKRMQKSFDRIDEILSRRSDDDDTISGS